MRFKIALLVLILASLACSANVTTYNTVPSPTPEIIASIVTDTPQSAIDSLLDSQPVVVPDAISSLHMLDAQNGWMITDATILRTQDGGSTWHDVTPPGAHALGFGTGASFLDSSRGWILVSDASDPANKGILYHTTDGGLHWNSNTVPFQSRDLYFLDDSNGWSMVNAGHDGAGNVAVRFYQTYDGGVNWTQVYSNLPTDPGAGDSLPYHGIKSGFTSISIQEAWVSGRTLDVNDFYLYHTLDGGHTWSRAEYQLPFTEERYITYPPVFFDTQFGILPFQAGSEGASLMFSFTEDGGKTWTIGEPVSGSSHYSVASPSRVFAWPDVFSISNDAGQSWTILHPNVDLSTNLLQLQFVDAQSGWAVTRDTNGHTSLYKTIDGGQTWIPQVE